MSNGGGFHGAVAAAIIVGGIVQGAEFRTAAPPNERIEIGPLYGDNVISFFTGYHSESQQGFVAVLPPANDASSATLSMESPTLGAARSPAGIVLQSDSTDGTTVNSISLESDNVSVSALTGPQASVHVFGSLTLGGGGAYPGGILEVGDRIIGDNGIHIIAGTSQFDSGIHVAAGTGTFDAGITVTGGAQFNNGISVTGNATASAVVQGAQLVASAPVNTLHLQLHDSTNGNQKYLRCNNGVLEFVNSANTTVIATMNDAGIITAPYLDGTNGGFLRSRQRTNSISFDWASPNVGVWVDATRIGTIATASDRRIKSNVTDMGRVLDSLMDVKLYRYDAACTVRQCPHPHPHHTWQHYGVIADELQAIFPALVSGQADAVDSEGNPVFQTVDYFLMIPYLLKAIQELTERLNHAS